MLGHLETCARHHETGAGGYVERVFAVAAGAHYIEYFVRREIHGDTRLDHAVAQTQDFIGLHSAQLKPHEQRGNARLVELSLGDAVNHRTRLGA